MESRRQFVKLLSVTIMSILGFAGRTPGEQAPGNIRDKTAKSTRTIGPWQRGIFCQFEDEELKKAIQQCSTETGCTIFWGEPGAPDIFAIGSFVNIIDRNVVGHAMWREYVECFDPVGDETPCFIVDNIKHLPVPARKYVYQFDMRDRRSIMTIVTTIKQVRREMDRRLPDLFKTR